MCRMPGIGYVQVRSHSIMSSSRFPGAYGSVHALVGLHIQSTAHLHLLYLLHSEFPLVVENPFLLTP